MFKTDRLLKYFSRVISENLFPNNYVCVFLLSSYQQHSCLWNVTLKSYLSLKLSIINWKNSSLITKAKLYTQVIQMSNQMSFKSFKFSNIPTGRLPKNQFRRRTKLQAYYMQSIKLSIFFHEKIYLLFNYNKLFIQDK